MSSRPSTARTDRSFFTNQDDRPHSAGSGSHSPFDDEDMDDDEEERQSSPENSHSPSARQSSSTLRVLARGNACLCCRRRKLKCDGTKPHCGPCTRGRRLNECVYEEAKIKTKTQVLQSRIRELEAKMKRMAEREKTVDAIRAKSPNVAASPSDASSSSRRNTLPISLQPPSHHHIAPTHANTFPSSLRTDTNFSTTTSTSDFAFTDPLLANFSWTVPPPASSSSIDFSYGQSELLQNVSAALANNGDEAWGITPTQTNSFGTGSWLDLLPTTTEVPTTLFDPSPLTAPTATTVAPSNLGPTSYVPSSSTSGFSASPSLSNAVSTTTSGGSSVSSPPSSAATWEDDMRLTALDLTRPMSDSDDVPPEIGRELVRVFMQHRRQCMFEVHTEHFLASLTSTGSTRPHPALLNAIYLLGCHFSPNSHLSQYENLFLARTRKGINHSLENADRLLNFLQASCLLAYYFFFKGRLLEGHYHASAAARFAMSCGLHLLKVKADGVQGTLTFYYPSGGAGDRSILPQPEDSIALAERINLFWSIFTADRTGSVGTGLPVVIRDEEIETPWPRRFEDFELNDLVRFDSTTLRSLYVAGNTGAYVRATDNLHAVKCKALALNERASRLASLLESDPNAVSDPNFWPQFDAIDGAISQFVDSLPPISSAAATSEWLWEDEEALDKTGAKSTVSPSLVLAYTAAYGAVIQLHRMFSQNDAGSYKRCLTAARSALKVVKESSALGVDVTFLPMALGIIWTSVAEALAVEYERLKRAKYPLTDIEEELTVLFTVMRNLRAVFPILTLRINKVPLFQGCSLEIDANQGVTPC